MILTELQDNRGVSTTRPTAKPKAFRLELVELGPRGFVIQRIDLKRRFDSIIRLQDQGSIICILGDGGQRLRIRKTKTGNTGVAADGGHKNFGNKYIEERRQKTALPDTPRQTKKGRKIAINIDRALNTEIKKVNPRNKRGAKTHSRECETHETPIDKVESLLLIKRKDGNQGTRGGGILNDVTKESNILTMNLPGTLQVWSLSTTRWITFNNLPAMTRASSLQSTLRRVIGRQLRRSKRSPFLKDKEITALR